MGQRRIDLRQSIDEIDSALDAAHQTCDALLSVIGMSDGVFTCEEAETFADLFIALGRRADARKFLRCHANSDGPEDFHYRKRSR